MEQALALTEEYAMLPPGGAVLCAVSGGADSMCLLHWLCTVAPQRGLTLFAAHFNHHLRGAESDRDAAFVTRWCGEQGIPLRLGEGDVAAEAERLGLGLEETARELRYTFLESARAGLGADIIATAHNADDNAETLLLHLVRGAGLQGLGGIPPRRGALVRPLLTTPRAEIEAYLSAHGVPHVEDSTNTDCTYTRNRVRHEVMPLLRQLNPRLTEHLSASARTLRADNDCLTAQAVRLAGEAIWDGDDLLCLPAAKLAQQPRPIAVRMARHLITTLGDGSGSCTAAHLLSVVALAHGQDPSASVDLPGGLTVRREYDSLLFTIAAPPPALEDIVLDPLVECHWSGPGWRILCRPALCPEQPKQPWHFYLCLPQGPLWIRARRTGDRITLPLRDQKSLKKLFIDAKIPRALRPSIPVLADDTGPLAVAGFGPSMPHLARPGDAALEVLIEKERS